MLLTRARSAASRHGGVLVKVAICLPALLAVVALNTDGGRMMDERRRVNPTKFTSPSPWKEPSCAVVVCTTRRGCSMRT